MSAKKTKRTEEQGFKVWIDGDEDEGWFELGTSASCAAESHVLERVAARDGVDLNDQEVTVFTRDKDGKRQKFTVEIRFEADAFEEDDEEGEDDQEDPEEPEVSAEPVQP